MDLNPTANSFRLPIITPSQIRLKWQKWVKKWRSYFRMAGRFTPLLKKRRKRLSVAFLCAVGYIAMGVAEPWPIKIIFDNVFYHKLKTPHFLDSVFHTLSQNTTTLLLILVFSMILIALVRGVFYFYYQLLASKTAQQVTADVRVDLYTHLQSLSFSFHDRRRTGDMIMRLTNDIRVLRDILVALPLTILSEFFLILGMVTVMFFMDWSLTLIALSVIPILAVLLRIYQKPMKQAARRQRQRDGRLATIANEALGAIKVVQSFRRENYEIDRFNTQNTHSLRMGLRATKLEAKFRWSADLAVAAIMAIVFLVASQKVVAGTLSPGDLIVFISYLRTFNKPLRRISTATERTARGTAAGERILEMLMIQPKIFDRPGAVSAGRLRGEIQFDQVSFSYGKNGKEVLTDINLQIPPGERVAFMGKTGAGKSTLVSLVPRFYEATSGSVLIDGRNTKDFTLASLRENISLVFQEPVLFATTISENIGYGKPGASKEEIIKAAKLAGIHDIISSLHEGYDTILGERGGTLSGGQRQCVAIARAIIKDAPIVILDEPTTGLDHQSATLVMQALHRLMENRTVLIISHHLNIVREATRVLVLRQGRIAEEGSPAKIEALQKSLQSLHTLEPEESLP
ncbi:MAG TPA: ABC transporter ATP-binding protein [bacterium]|nr:ABC transporter ATP-binding protein [bacterium]